MLDPQLWNERVTQPIDLVSALVSLQDSSTTMLLESDTRAMVRLLAEVGGAQGSLTFKRNLLMNGLCELVGVDAWYWCAIGNAEVGKQISFAIQQKGGLTDEQFAKHLKALEHPDMKMLNAPFIEECAAKKTHVTRLRQQIDKEG